MYNLLFKRNSNQNIGQNSRANFKRAGFLLRKNSSGINAILDGSDDAMYGQDHSSYDYPLLHAQRRLPTAQSHSRFTTTTSSNLHQFNVGPNYNQGKHGHLTIQSRATYNTLQPSALNYNAPSHPTDYNGNVQNYNVRPDDRRVVLRESYESLQNQQNYQGIQQNTHFASSPVARPLHEVASNVYYNPWPETQEAQVGGTTEGYFAPIPNQAPQSQPHPMQSASTVWNVPSTHTVQLQFIEQPQYSSAQAPVYQSPGLSLQSNEYQPPRQAIVSGYDHSYTPYQSTRAHFQPAVIPTGPIFGDGQTTRARPTVVSRFRPYTRPAAPSAESKEKKISSDPNGNEASNPVPSEARLSVRASNENCGDVDPSVSPGEFQQQTKSPVSVYFPSQTSVSSVPSPVIDPPESAQRSEEAQVIASGSALPLPLELDRPSSPNVILSIGSALVSAAVTSVSLFSNIVPSESKGCTKEEMNACERDVPVCVMRAVGLPQLVRYSIYDEVCGELEAIQDLGSGTCEAVYTMLKWIYAGNREKLADFVRKVCLIHTEVELDSDVWDRVKWYKREPVIIEEADAVIEVPESAPAKLENATDMDEQGTSANIEPQPHYPFVTSNKKPPLPIPKRYKSVSFAVNDADVRSSTVVTASSVGALKKNTNGCSTTGYNNGPKNTVSCPVIEKASDVPIEPLTPELVNKPAKSESDTTRPDPKNQRLDEKMHIEIEHSKRPIKTVDKLVIHRTQQMKPIIISKPNLSSTTFFQPIDWDSNFLTQKDAPDTETGKTSNTTNNNERNRHNTAQSKPNSRRISRATAGTSRSKMDAEDPSGLGVNLGPAKSLCSIPEASSQEDLMDLRDQ